MKIILIISLVFFILLIRLYKWMEKNTYSDPSNGTVYKYPETGKTAIFQYMDQIDKANDNNSI
jgi:hypothetical protein